MCDYPSFDQIELTMFPTKYVRGGESGVRAPVAALLQPYDSDVHYTCYVEESVTRLRKDEPHGPLSFRIVVYDLDAHGARKATNADFSALVDGARGLPHPPNWVSRSKNGAHALFLTSEIEDPSVYEATRQEFAAVVAPITAGTVYALDATTADWTRMLRSPRVLRSDMDDAGGIIVATTTDLRDARIEVIHGDVLDLSPWETEPRPRTPVVAARRGPAVRGPWARRVAARWLAEQPGAVSGDGGHRTAFKIACRLVAGFGLSEDDAYELMAEAWNPRCQPPWSERELRHKIADATRVTGATR